MDSSFIDALSPAWHQRPALFRRPAWARWATPELVNEGLHAAAETEDATWRLFHGATMVSRHDPKVLPHAQERELSTYLARLARDHAAPGLIINQFQATSRGCWEAIAPLVSAIYTAFGTSHGGALVDLFLTGATPSFFGAHKDDQDVFMFVAAGCKRVELWSYDALGESVGTPGYYTPRHLGQLEREPELVFEVHAGDVLYWPAGYWHRIHNLGELTAGLSLGLFTRPDPLAFLAQLSELDVAASPRNLQQPRRRRDLGPGGCIDAQLDGLLSALGTERDPRAHLREALLSFKSRLGFRSTPRSPRPASAENSVLRTPAPGVIELLEDGEQLLVGAAGSVVRYPNDPGLRLALTRLATGEALTIDELELAVLAGDPSWSAFEPAERRALLDKLLCDLAEVCALVPCETAPMSAVA